MNNRCFVILDKHGTKYQFGGTPKVGCNNIHFTFIIFFNLRKNHNLPTYIEFSDLMKRFDSVDHELLVEILEKFGDLPKFCSAVEGLYKQIDSSTRAWEVYQRNHPRCGSPARQ